MLPLPGYCGGCILILVRGARFDFSIFTYSKHTYPVVKEQLSVLLKKFWQEGVELRRRHNQSTTVVSWMDAFDLLTEKFGRASCPQDSRDWDSSLLRRLSPQLIVLLQAHKEELRKHLHIKPVSMSEEFDIFSVSKEFQLARGQAPVPVVFIGYPFGAIATREKDNPKFERLRELRNFCAWFHTDVQLLEQLLRFGREDPACLKILTPHIVRIAEGLGKLREACLERRVRLCDVLQDNTITRARRQAEELPLAEKGQQRILVALDHYLSVCQS